MIINEDVYAGAEIVNETVNELVVYDSAILLGIVILLIILFSIASHLFIVFKVNKLEDKIIKLERSVR